MEEIPPIKKQKKKTIRLIDDCYVMRVELLSWLG